MNIHKPTKEELKPLIAEIGDITQWEPKIVASLGDFLSKNPLRYRGYGPYWWVVKQAMIEHGETRFGDHVDLELVESLDYGDRAINLIAAYAYSESMFDLGLMTSSKHTLYDENGESFEYVIADDEMEALHVMSQLR